MKHNKTNAMRILDAYNIKYSLIEYDVDESDLSAVHLAQQLGQPSERIFKTLVLKGDKSGIIVAVIPAIGELNLKHLAYETCNKSCEMIPMKDLLQLTGYIRGGCSPIGMKKKFPTYIDSSYKMLDYIYISGGKRGLQIKLNPVDIIQLLDIKISHLVD